MTRLSSSPCAVRASNLSWKGMAGLSAEPASGIIWSTAPFRPCAAKFGWRRGVRARLVKRIPGRPRAWRRLKRCGRGDPGHDAAGPQARFPTAHLIELGSSLGADVPFFFSAERALGVGRGDEIYPLPDGPHQPCWWSPRAILPCALPTPTPGSPQD